MYTYEAAITKVVDGDTVHVDWDLGHDIHVFDTIRLLGINSPEKNTKAGKESAAFLTQLLPVGTVVTLTTVKDKREKYGRYLGTLTMDGGTVVNELMIDEGYAVEYWGGAR